MKIYDTAISPQIYTDTHTKNLCKYPKNLRFEPTLFVAAVKINKHTAHNQKRHHQQVQYTVIYALAHVVARRPRRLQRRIAHGALRMARTHYQTNKQQAQYNLFHFANLYT